MSLLIKGSHCAGSSWRRSIVNVVGRRHHGQSHHPVSSPGTTELFASQRSIHSQSSFSSAAWISSKDLRVTYRQKPQLQQGNFIKRGLSTNAQKTVEEVENATSGEDPTDTANDGGDSSTLRRDILTAALARVGEYGWTEDALVAGAKDCGLPATSAGMFNKGAIELVRFVMEKTRNNLMQRTQEEEYAEEEAGADILSKEADLGDTGLGKEQQGQKEEKESVRAARAIETRIKAIIPYASSWAHAMGLGLMPQNLQGTAKDLAQLADDIAYVSGDRSTNMSWYTKRAFLATTLVTAELFMLTDKSADFEDTKKFVHRRMSDYEALTQAPENLQDVAAGATTAVTSLGSAILSFALPVIKQLPGSSSLKDMTDTTPPAVAAVMQAVMSNLASLRARGTRTGTDATESKPRRGGGASGTGGGGADMQQEPVEFKAAPEEDPWEKSGTSSLHDVERNATVGSRSGAGK